MASSNSDSRVEWFDSKSPLFGEAYKIRFVVFVEEQKVPAELERDEYEDKCHHALILIGETPAACCRILPLGDDEWKLQRMAVLTEFRSKGLGKALAKEALEKIRRLGGKKVKIHAQKYALNFYEKLGFKQYGEDFEEAGITHVEMSQDL